MFHAHMGWLFDREQTNPERYAPDLLKDTDVCGSPAGCSRCWAFLSLAAARR